MRSEALRPRMVWNIAWRDLLSTLRDRRTLTSTILLPLLVLPLLTLGMPLLMGSLMGGQVRETQKVGVIGTLPPELHRTLTRSEGGGSGVRLQPVQDPIQAVRSGEVEAVIRVPRPLPTQAGNAQGTLELYAKLGNLKSQTGAYAKVRSAVESYNRSLTGKRLTALGLSESVLTPVQVKSVDASPPQEKSAGVLAFLVPMLMLNFLLSGAMATALDSTAGEKERGTLESLLVSPVRRGEVVAGKLLATTLTALVTGVFSLLGFLGTGLVAAALTKRAVVDAQAMQMMGGQFTLTLGSLAAMAVIVLSVALLISAVLIALSIYARSYKEAQTYVSPLSLLIVIPAVMLQFSDFLKAGDWLYATPLFGSMVAILDVVKGQITPQHTLAAVLANLLGAAVLGWLAWKSFGREEVIFRN
ncbi:ABC transporter [Deinococcus wulumuqiensis]|uniref:ABC transporter n=2 Tax=Deinococcus wulumuqiensis TaxID=980427 RepID=A0AAV4K0D6_9DEIO|nr:ABC transporter [Deinococcus wulumuqiensis]GGP28570.1 ABC transporter [Deinococcus wulumuqiensis]